MSAEINITVNLTGEVTDEKMPVNGYRHYVVIPYVEQSEAFWSVEDLSALCGARFEVNGKLVQGVLLKSGMFRFNYL